MNRYEKYYENGGNFLKDINHEGKEHVGVIPRSAGFISPGDVLSFVYPGSEGYLFLLLKLKEGMGYSFPQGEIC